jgi:hypothetical protein
MIHSFEEIINSLGGFPAKEIGQARSKHRLQNPLVDSHGSVELKNNDKCNKNNSKTVFTSICQ